MLDANLPAVVIASITAVLFLILLTIVFIANPRNKVNQAFSLYLIFSLGWSVFTAISAWDVNPQQEYLANYLLNILGIFPAAISYFFFCLIFLKKPFKWWLFYAVVTYLIASYLMLSHVYSVVDQPFLGGYGFHGRQQVGSLLYLIVIWGSLFIGALLVYLGKELLTSTDKVHLQKVRLLTLATVIGAGAAIVFNAIPPLWVFPVDILGQLIAASILTYAILRFELVDVTTKFRNIIVETIFTTLLAAGFLFTLVVLQLLFRTEFILWIAIILAVFITSLSQPLKERVLKFVDITFYRTRYDYRETINKFAQKVGEILNLNNLAFSIIKTVKDTFGASEVNLFLFHKGFYYPFNFPQEGGLQFSETSGFIRFLKNSNQVVARDEFSRQLDQFPEARSQPSEIIIPLRSGTDLVGILFVYKRVSGDFYSREDKNLLFTLSQASAIALKNSLLYQEVVEKTSDIEGLLEREREVNESKDEFITIASHYLRTPLTTIKGYLYLLINEKLPPQEASKYLLRAFNEQKKLASLVEDVISISALEKGELKLFREKTSLSNIVKKVLEDFDSLATEKGVGLEVDIKNDIEVEVDSQKITQAVSNLVSNAVKFTSVGKVTIFAGVDEGQAKICVKDTGIGIESNQIEQLFQKFHRGTDTKTYNYEGSGLGLYIAKLIVDAHQGKITVNSKLGQGSSFCIYLPLKKKP